MKVLKDKKTAILMLITLATTMGVNIVLPEVVNAKSRNNCENVQISSIEAQVLQFTNQERSKYGLPPLKWNQKLSRAACYHSSDMSKYGYIYHQSPNGLGLSDRAQQVGYRYSYLAENVASGHRTPQEVVRAWMKSSGHRQNILNPNLTEIGVGYVNNYWTQMFARPQ
jgi:uncharacterized protein YkwD